MNFVNYGQLSKDVLDFSQYLPRFDLVAGVPRSGVLPAYMLAMIWNCKFGVVKDGIKILSGGDRDQERKVEKILVLDDSLDTGKTMGVVKNELSPFKNIYFGAVYVTPEKEKTVDYYYETMEQPRIFEWNFAHHGLLARACMDIDGVLCEDPTELQNDDGEGYKEFLSNARPRYIPTVPVHSLVTSRLEKYRSETRRWLRGHGIVYRNLIMSPHDSKETREKANDHAEQKADYYGQSDTVLFIESSSVQAKKIRELSEKPVLCIETMET